MMRNWTNAMLHGASGTARNDQDLGAGRLEQVQAFLAPYAGRQDATSRGVRGLLLHWLGIGAAIRDAARGEPEQRTGKEVTRSDETAVVRSPPSHAP